MAVFLSTFLPDSDPSAKSQEVDSGITNKDKSASVYRLVEEADIRGLLQPRAPFSHKGTYGHALIIAGEIKTMGAALLAAKGCLYGGAGLTTASVPESGLIALNTALPEVMYLERNSLIPISPLDKYQAIAIGPGIGKHKEGKALLKGLLTLNRPVIIDADGLGLLADYQKLLSNVPANSILSPHMKEFDGLFGKHKTWWDRLQTARKEAKERNIVIVLKNQYTFIIDQQGDVAINPTGNPAMAQGGMGDVLTGLLAAYTAQGYTPKEAAILACYIHGKAGDRLSETYFNVTASQVAEQLPEIVKSLIK